MQVIAFGHQNQPFELLEKNNGRVKISDGKTKAKWVPRNNVAQLPQAYESQESLNNRKLKEQDIYETNNGYFRQPLTEQEVLQGLVERGLPLEIAQYGIGYTEQDFPFEYRETLPHQVHQGGDDPQTSLMYTQVEIATVKPLADVNTEKQTAYGSSSVLAQWVSYDFRPEADVERIERTESERISDEMYVKRIYSNVSDLGELDGELTELVIYKYTEEPLWNKGWKGVEYRRKTLPTGDFVWKTPKFEFCGEPYLNGAQQMMMFSHSPIECLKGE